MMKDLLYLRKWAGNADLKIEHHDAGVIIKSSYTVQHFKTFVIEYRDTIDAFNASIWENGTYFLTDSEMFEKRQFSFVDSIVMKYMLTTYTCAVHSYLDKAFFDFIKSLDINVRLTTVDDITYITSEKQ